MDQSLDSGTDAGSEGTGGNDVELDIGSTLADIVKSRGDALGDGAPPEPAPKPPVPATPPPPAAPPVGAPAPAPGAPAAPAPPASPQAERRPPDLTKAPTSWKPEVAAAWANLPPEVQAEIHRREEDSFKGVSEVRQVADVGRRFQQAISPYMGELQQYGIDPYAHINNLMGAHRTLALGTPAQKTAMMAQLSREYKVPLPGAAPAEEEGWIDPQVKTLREEVDGLKSARQAEAQQKANEHRQKLVDEITAFSKDTANPHFDEVADGIALLVKGDPKMTLREAYDKAVWLNPAVRAKVLEKQQQTAVEDAKKAEEARAQAAAKATGLVPKSSSKAASDTGKLGTIEDTLKAKMREIESRAK